MIGWLPGSSTPQLEQAKECLALAVVRASESGTITDFGGRRLDGIGGSLEFYPQLGASSVARSGAHCLDPLSLLTSSSKASIVSARPGGRRPWREEPRCLSAVRRKISGRELADSLR
jgi:hypothetical protein